MVFEPEATNAMSMAFDEVCRALGIAVESVRERETIAVRIVELARRGERDAIRLRERVLREAAGA
jgi:CO/xanthine dehydrogenase Mo-binding subunit